jgi:hypothetical protein
MKIALLFLVLIVPFVCAARSSHDETGVTIKMTNRGSAFEAVENKDSAIPKGYSDLLITITLKTLREDSHFIKTMPTRPDDYMYPVVINIDGQDTQWRAQCKPDKQKRYVDWKRNPEGGEGFKCSLIKRLRLKSGTHLFYVALPEDKLEGEVRITLMDGEINNMELRPVYWRNRPFGPDFTHGVESLNVILNGQTIGPLLRPASKPGTIDQ